MWGNVNQESLPKLSRPQFLLGVGQTMQDFHAGNLPLNWEKNIFMLLSNNNKKFNLIISVSLKVNKARIRKFAENHLLNLVVFFFFFLGRIFGIFYHIVYE